MSENTEALQNNGNYDTKNSGTLEGLEAVR